MDRTIKAGVKVYYTTPHGKKENGIVKSMHENDMLAFVVYHCDNDWKNYKDYTGAATNVSDLTFGWVDEHGNLLKEYCDHYYVADNTKWTPIGRMTCQNCGDVIN